MSLYEQKEAFIFKKSVLKFNNECLYKNLK